MKFKTKHIQSLITCKSAILPALIAFFLFASTSLYPFSLANADVVQDFLNGQNYEPIQEEEIQVTTLEDAKANLSAIQNEYNQLMDQVNALQQDIDAKVEEALPVQQEYLEGRQKVADLLREEYKDSTSGEILNLILSSTSIKDFFQQLDYAGHIIAYRTSVLAEQEERANAFQSKLDELNSERDQQCSLLLALQRKKDLAERILAEAKAKFGDVDLSFNQDIDNSSGSSISPFRPDPTPTPVPEPDPQPEPTEEGWRTGIASAYGGSSDPYTPNPGISCIGELVDDWSCGVAVPMAWNNYRSYLRRNVLISYNGMQVIARVNDCGYMGGGSRSLDLQPGIFKQFGFQTCNAWGLRQVSFKFL
ncbi:MAG: hypothetical protein HUJ51_00385 [Eggerthellaceae bacterium]|nr:hypothetical protein [Eggerthellaceae bacterium]